MHTIKPHPSLLENGVLDTVHVSKICQKMESGGQSEWNRNCSGLV